MPRTNARPDNIDKVLKEVAKPSLSREEMKAQRVSFAMGMRSSPKGASRKQLEDLVEQRY